MPKRASSPSLVSQEIAARRKDRDAPEVFATWETGVEWRDCALCDNRTDRPDRICRAHDHDFPGPLWGRGYGELDLSSTEYVAENRRRIREWYAARGYEGVER